MYAHHDLGRQEGGTWQKWREQVPQKAQQEGQTPRLVRALLTGEGAY